MCTLFVFGWRMKRTPQLQSGWESGIEATSLLSLPTCRTESQRKKMENEKLWGITHSCNYSEEVYCICMFPQ